MIEVRAIFTGKVQGVGFRAAARRLAGEAKVAGSAENLPDGTVEIFAQGTREQLDQFIYSINVKFDIQSIDCDYYEVTTPKAGFDIL